MAKLAAVLDSLDGLDDGLKDFYVERDGKHYLDAEGVEDVSGLKSTLEKQKREAKEARRSENCDDGGRGTLK